MFLCDDCHDDRCSRTYLEGMMRSRGRCEDCGNGAACRDCQGWRDLPPTAPVHKIEEEP